MVFVPRRRRTIRRLKDMAVLPEEPIKRGTSEPVTHTTLHHGADILELTVKTLRQGDGFLCTKRTFDAIEERANDYYRSQYPKVFKSKEWDGLWYTRRVA